jgi:hypothetical protein
VKSIALPSAQSYPTDAMVKQVLGGKSLTHVCHVSVYIHDESFSSLFFE